MKKNSVTIMGLALLLSLPMSGAQDRRAGWGDLEPGPHAVGFKLTTAYDQSRVYSSNPGFRGLPEGAETARAVRIYLWYPAESAKGEALRLGDYVRMAAEDFGPAAAGKTRRDGSLPLPVPLAKGLSAEKRRALFAERTAAVPRAEPSARRFPLVVLGQGLYYESPLALFTLAEYLASRGYVVATCPLLGTYSRLAHLTVADLETQVRDMEFVIAETRLLPFVDRDRVGLVGYDLGGMSGLILAMRNPWIKAMATIDSAVLSRHFSGLPGNSPHYRESRFVIPWLIMVQGRFAAARGAEEKTLFDRKTAGDSYLYYFDTDNHGAFTSYATLGIESEVPGFWGPVKGNMRRVAETVCRSTGRFFDGYLKKDAGALDVLRREPGQAGLADVLVSVKAKTGEAAPLFQDDWVNDIIERGTAAALPRIRQALASGGGRVELEESALNWLGLHFLLWWGREPEAVDVFQLMTEMFPRSADAFESLGDACRAVGDRERALAGYRKSLELNPDNARAKALIKSLEEKK